MNTPDTTEARTPTLEEWDREQAVAHFEAKVDRAVAEAARLWPHDPQVMVPTRMATALRDSLATLRQRCERLEDLVEQQGQLLTAKHDEFLRVEARANERREEIRRLREAALECAADLEAELHARYHDENGCVHPAEQHRYERDMEPVWRVRALTTPEAPDEH